MRIVLRHLLVPLAAVLLAAGDAAAQTSIEASPLRIELQTAPGKSHTQAVTVRNPGGAPVRVRTTIADWHLTRDGAPQFQLPAPDRPYAAASWVRFAPPEFRLEPGQEGRVRFTLDVPADAAPAGYRTALLFEFLPETPELTTGRAVVFRSRIATLIYVNVGNPAAAVEMTALDVRGTGDDTAIVAGLKNSGRSTVRTKGSLVVYDAAGMAVATLIVPDVPVLPETERELKIRAADAIRKLLPGAHRVELKLDLGMPALVVGETTMRVER